MDDCPKCALDEHPPGTAFYVSAVEGRRWTFLLGPYETHAEALARVERGRAIVREHYPDLYPWVGIGTASVTPGETHPEGRFNALAMEG